MTDDRMDAQLRAAGEHWRAGNTAVADVDLDAARQGEPPRAPELTLPSTSTNTASGTRSHRRWGLLASAAVVVAALVVGGVYLARGTSNDAPPAAGTQSLVGTVWRLVDPHGANVSGLLRIGGNGALVADDECVVIGGRARTTDDSITVTGQIARYKSCTDQYGEKFSGAGVDVLRGESTYRIDTHGLTITKGSATLQFAPAADGTAAPTLHVATFVGADWRLVTAKDASGTSVRVGGAPVLHIDDDGTLAANDGCNAMSGRVRGQDSSRPTLENVGGTEIGCFGDQQKTAEVVDSVLTGQVTQQVVDDELTITKPGAGTLTYRWDREAGSSGGGATPSGEPTHGVTLGPTH